MLYGCGYKNDTCRLLFLSHCIDEWEDQTRATVETLKYMRREIRLRNDCNNRCYAVWTKKRSRHHGIELVLLPLERGINKLLSRTTETKMKSLRWSLPQSHFTLEWIVAFVLYDNGMRIGHTCCGCSYKNDLHRLLLCLLWTERIKQEQLWRHWCVNIDGCKLNGEVCCEIICNSQ